MSPISAPPADAQRLRLHWPEARPDGATDNFFLGCFNPTCRLSVSWDRAPTTAVATRHGPNWFLASAISPEGQGLVHASLSRGAVAFRGYVLPDIHTYTSSTTIESNWLLGVERHHHGVYSVAVIDQGEQRLTLETDLLGIGTLYWRQLGSTVLFSTSPRFLACTGDTPDRLAWRCLVHSSWIAADRSLTEGVFRVPAGKTVRVSPTGVRIDGSRFDSIPIGTRRMDARALGEIEEVFQQALDRCVRLSHGNLMLPLSSGFDSRRILAGLVRGNRNFTAVTCRLIQSERMDLDARFASAMARDFEFDHAVVEAAEDRYLTDDLTRRTLLDGESVEHTWAIRVLYGGPTKYGSILDGIAGDVLGDPVGWTEQLGVPLPDSQVGPELDAIVGHAIGLQLESVLAAGAWCSTAEAREDLRTYLSPLSDRPNLGELSFLLLRQRRAVALWSQQLVPPGVVPLYPYLDPDYLSLLLSISSGDKHAADIQRSCLREFWPEFAQYPGTRDVPSELRPDLVATEKAHSAACQRQLRREINASGAKSTLHQMLTAKGRIALEAGTLIQGLAPRWRWYLIPVMELVSRHVRGVPIWELEAGA